MIIPVYNRADTVDQAIRSVLAQTSPVLEVIVVDDGSSDDSAAVVAGIEDPRVRMLRQPNGGAASARNRALDVVEGDWIAFLDADDWWLEHRVASAVAALDADPSIDFMQANRMHVYPDGRTDRGLKAGADVLRDRLKQLGGFTIKTSAVMIRRSLIEDHALRFPIDQQTCEDYHLFWRAVFFARSIGFTEAQDVMIRALPGSLSRGSKLDDLQKDNIKTLIEVREWAKRHDVREAYVDAVAEHLHWQFRDYFETLMKSGRLGALMRYATLAARQEGLGRGARGLLSAALGLLKMPQAGLR